MAEQGAATATNGVSEDLRKGSFRRKVAQSVIQWSGAVLIALTIVISLVAAAAYDPNNPQSINAVADIVQTYVYAVLPMIGTWVGTVLAFYFTNDSYQTASTETRLTISESREAKLRKVPARDAMKSLSGVHAIAEDKANWPNLNFKTGVLDFLDAKKVGRLPVFDKARSRVHGIVHDSVIKDFALRNKISPTVVDGSPSTATLQSFLSDPEVSAVFDQSVAIVGPDATLADVKNAMDAMNARGVPCRDVFVTEDGTANGKPLGLITNIDLERFSTYG
ncbi:hypothetical protein [Amorphus orientalis]|uniref:CBS domain-containing protein n=1 Tax=Amorphus orientalis TaxID=649198 RepID=A0AAE4ARL7_9HYPH|nr:hypothetical protein [Amorphus orientalis]MDQ0315281.1 CBS domain-containing protein [Amorphus orientalis]